MNPDELYRSEPPVLERERVRLRPFRAEDAAPLFAIYSDRETTRYLARPALTHPSQAEAIVTRALAAYDDGRNLHLAIERTSDGVFLGMCLLFHFHKPSARAAIRYTPPRYP